jgi:predicted enzyme related to lactoylglutathione lyase
MGIYQLFATGDVPVGGIMTKPAVIPMPYWGYYFNVDGIDAAAARVTAAGGTVINGPHQVPGGQWIVQGTDPQGAVFALVAMQR